MGNGLPPGTALIASCNWHRERPDHACRRCRDAITVNRMNPGWGKQEVRLGPEQIVEYFRYDPHASWMGPGVFADHLIAADGSVFLIPRAMGRHREAPSGR